MLQYVAFMAVGLFLLAEGSQYFVRAAVEIARRFRVSEIMIGVTLVSASTTLPELMASTTASYLGSSGVAVGNAVGSDITNIALILGLCMVVTEYRLTPEMTSHYGVPLFLVCIFFCVLLPGGISRIDGCILLAAFLVYLWVMSTRDIGKRPESSPATPEISAGKVVLFFVGGILAVFVGARLLVSSSLQIAGEFELLESAIGSTIVALGTSLPELAISLRAVTGRHEQISIGNILGANTFNLLWVTGASALVNPLTLDRNLLYFNVPLMLGVTIVLLVFMSTEDQLKRWEGAALLCIYALFVANNFL